MRNRYGLDFSDNRHYFNTKYWEPWGESKIYKQHPVAVANCLLLKSICGFIVDEKALQIMEAQATHT